MGGVCFVGLQNSQKCACICANIISPFSVTVSRNMSGGGLRYRLPSACLVASSEVVIPSKLPLPHSCETYAIFVGYTTSTMEAESVDCLPLHRMPFWLGAGSEVAFPSKLPQTCILPHPFDYPRLAPCLIH